MLGRWNVGARAAVRSAGNVTNFFGLGNETVRDGSTPELFETGLGQLSAELPLQRRFATGTTLELAPTVQMAWIDEERAGSLIGLDQPGLSTPTGEEQVFVGARASLGLVYRDDADNPRAGYTWAMSTGTETSAPATRPTITARWRPRSRSTPRCRRRARSRSPSGPAARETSAPSRSTPRARSAARRTCAASAAPASGRTSFYTNAEIRLALFGVKWAALPGQVGALAFVDHGRVWTDGERSDTWHRGYGGGLWYDILDEIVVSATYGASKEGTYLLTGLGFLF